MANILKITAKGQRPRMWDYSIERDAEIAVIKAAFPNWVEPEDGPYHRRVDSIEIKAIGGTSGISFYYEIKGIQLSCESANYKHIMKRVMVKNDSIDIDQIRAKHAELVKLSKEAAIQRKKTYEEYEQWLDTELTLRSQLGLTSDDDWASINRTDPPTVHIELNRLSLEKAVKIIAIVKSGKMDTEIKE